TPRLVAAATSMLSTPMPARPITRSASASARVSAVTFVRLRTMSAWKPRIAARSSPGPSSVRATTSSSERWRSCASPSGPSGSVSRTRYVISACGQTLGEHRLGGADAAPELDRRAEVAEPELECCHAGHHVEGVDVTEVRDPDDLSLEPILAPGEGHPDAVAQVAEERAAVETVRQADRGGGRARRLGGEQAEAEGRRRGARRARQPVVAGVDLREPLVEHQAERGAQSIDERDGRRPGGRALGHALPFAAEVEVEARQPRALRRRP